MMAGGGLTGDAAILSDDVRRFKEESEKEIMEVSRSRFRLLDDL